MEKFLVYGIHDEYILGISHARPQHIRFVQENVMVFGGFSLGKSDTKNSVENLLKYGV